MEVLLDTNTHTLGLALSCSGIGFCVGAVICGLIYDRYSVGPLWKEMNRCVGILVVVTLQRTSLTFAFWEFVIGDQLCLCLSFSSFRLNSELQFALFSLLEGVPLIIAPYYRDVIFFISALVCHGVARGFIDTGKSVIFFFIINRQCINICIILILALVNQTIYDQTIPRVCSEMYPFLLCKSLKQ